LWLVEGIVPLLIMAGLRHGFALAYIHIACMIYQGGGGGVGGGARRAISGKFVILSRSRKSD
jgi:hypothetical protein